MIPSLGLVVAAWNDRDAAWGDERRLSPGDHGSRMNKNLQLITLSARNVTDRDWRVEYRRLGRSTKLGPWVRGRPDCQTSCVEPASTMGGQSKSRLAMLWQRRFTSVMISAGMVSMSGGTLTADHVIVGFQGVGAFDMSGGSLNVPYGLHLGLGGDAAGVFQLSGGALSVGTISNGEGGSAFDLVGGTLHADIIDFSLVNEAGVLSPGKSIGKTAIHGDYTQSNGASLRVELDDMSGNPGTGWDIVEVDGLARLAGTIQLVVAGDFLPMPGDEFDILRASDGIEASGLNLVEALGYQWVLNDNSTILSVRYVPEPSAIVLFGTACLALLWRVPKPLRRVRPH